MLREYAHFLLEHHIDELTAVDLRLAIELDIPLMRFVSHMSDEEQFELTKQGLVKLLEGIINGTALANTAEGLRAWEEDRLPLGISKHSFEPSDLVLGSTAQKQALLQFLSRFTTDVAVAQQIALELEQHYIQGQNEGFKLFTRLRDEAAERIRELASDLERERRFLEGIIHHVPAGIMFVDREDTIRWVNPSASRFIGRDADSLVGLKFFGNSPQRFRDALGGHFEHVVETGEVYNATGFPAEIRDRVTYWDFSYVPVRNQHGVIEGVLVLSVDATSRVQNERYQRDQIQHLENLDRLKDEFLAILSHELRTPINAIMGFGSVLEDGLAGPLNNEQHSYVSKMLGGADTLLALVNDLLDMSRIQAGEFALSPAPMDLAALLAQVTENLRPLAQQKQLHVCVETPAELPALQADGQRVEQVVVNLLGNAIKFTPRGGRVTVRATCAPEAIRCEVEDTGVGIAKEDLSKLFKRFGQLDTSATRTSKGTGLGLAIAKALVEAHGGEIGVESVPGAGSTFWFTLPVREAAGTPVPARESASQR
ncbi:MAG TPA: ATP-binding protein [Oscillatoriaceae cyanobacterium]